MTIPNWATLGYLVAIALFILGIKQLTSAKTALRGNRVAGVGMLVAIGVTLGMLHSGWQYVIPAAAAGTLVGVVVARRVAMTAMPQLVALFNGMGAGAAALIALGDFHRVTSGAHPSLDTIGAVTILLSCLIGGISFSGSLIAFAKLQEWMRGTPITWPLQHEINGVLLAALVGIGLTITLTHGGPLLIIVFAAGALTLGVLSVLPVGGADMPVIIALLNSFTGIAAAVTGFVLGNDALIVAGALVGASGSILTMLMSKAMNRPITNVLFGAFGKLAEDGGEGGAVHGTVRQTNAEDLAVLLTYAQQVIFVPGYGLAVARAQHEVKELATQLEQRGVRVLYAIHPVAGRMPGHMNVLLAEADVPYSQLKEMDDVNPEFPRTDVALVIGANDVVNPAARSQPGSPIYGMPILNVDQAKTVVVLKRSMRPGFAGIENELFYRDNTMMLFGDAKDSLAKLTAEVKLQAAA
jgi:NAD(P) transhydrogenase subunit beta